MDLLAQRYASPFLILDEFIRLHQLYEFTLEVMKTMAEEKKHEVRWQYYLHKVFNMTFEDYVKACDSQKEKEQNMTHEEIGNIINDSKMLLDGFVPQ